MRNTGLYYYGARYYNPRESLWLSVDPLAEQTMDAYGYAYQNPINLIDPTGMSVELGSQKEWDKQKQGVVSERDKLQAKVDKINADGAKKG